MDSIFSKYINEWLKIKHSVIIENQKFKVTDGIVEFIQYGIYDRLCDLIQNIFCLIANFHRRKNYDYCRISRYWKVDYCEKQ